MLRVVSYVVNAVIAVALTGVILLFAMPRLLGWDLVVVLSGSMEPALPVGSAILVRPVQPETVEPGDIITYRAQGDGNAFVTHRVVEVQGEGPMLVFRTKGDANDKPDEVLVPAAAIKGRVLVDIPHLGYVAREVRKPQGFLLLMGVPATLIIAGEVRNIVREVRALRARRKAT